MANIKDQTTEPTVVEAARSGEADGVEDPYAVRMVEIPASKWTRRYRSVAFQMVVLAILSFSGPSMSNGMFSCCPLPIWRTLLTEKTAISGLGGGGLATPYTANAASATQYSTSALIACVFLPVLLDALYYWLPALTL